MKIKNGWLVATLGLLAALTMGASAQTKCGGGGDGKTQPKCGGASHGGKVEIQSLDNTVRNEQDSEIELVHGSSLDEKISAQGKKLALKKKYDACNDEDFDPIEKIKEMEYDSETGKVWDKEDTDPAKANAKFDLKLKYLKGKPGKHCIKDAMIVLKKKLAAYNEEIKAKYVGGSAGLDGEKAKFEIVLKKKLASAKLAKLKIDTDGGVKKRIEDDVEGN